MELTREENAVWQVVSQYDKREPISRGELVHKVAQLGFDLPERTVRTIIEALRNKDYLICSVSGKNGGYYMARSMEEYQEFKRMEYMAKITTMLATVSHMDKAAARQFGQVYQASIFGGGF